MRRPGSSKNTAFTKLFRDFINLTPVRSMEGQMIQAGSAGVKRRGQMLCVSLHKNQTGVGKNEADSGRPLFLTGAAIMQVIGKSC
ncbi:MAG: hypothetical protein ACOYXC_00890 [Candidatus Rifleibacteriota bacterium]